MLRAAQSSGKVHQVAFTFRYGYAVRELRRRVQAGDIGQPHYVRIQYDSWKGLMPEWEVGWVPLRTEKKIEATRRLENRNEESVD